MYIYLHVRMSMCVVSSEAKGIKSSKVEDTKGDEPSHMDAEE